MKTCTFEIEVEKLDFSKQKNKLFKKTQAFQKKQASQKTKLFENKQAFRKNKNFFY